jgi:hypothetical protein
VVFHEFTYEAGDSMKSIGTSFFLINAEAFSCDWHDRSVAVNYRNTGDGDGDLLMLEFPKNRPALSALFVATSRNAADDSFEASESSTSKHNGQNNFVFLCGRVCALSVCARFDYQQRE